MGYYFYFPPENKIVVARYAEFLEKNLLSQEVSRRAEELEEIQDKDTSPSENISKIPMEVEGFEPPQEEVVPVRKSARTHRAPNRLCLNVEVDEHSLGDLNEPNNYKAAILDPESNKLVDAMNAEMQSIKDNQNLGKPHWTAMKTILKYLKNIKDMILVYDGNPEAELRVDFYCNARFETNRNDIKSQTGYVSVLNRGVVDWKSSKQSEINILKVHTDDNLANSFTKALPKGKLTQHAMIMGLRNGYSQKDKNKAKTGQNRARDWKERGKPKPKAYAS
ncbi:hypothetical protein Tco_1320137 [Tanacetum coccineum]